MRLSMDEMLQSNAALPRSMRIPRSKIQLLLVVYRGLLTVVGIAFVAFFLVLVGETAGKLEAVWTTRAAAALVVSITVWLIVPLVITIAIDPRWQFSLRTLTLANALLVALVGLCVNSFYVHGPGWSWVLLFLFMMAVATGFAYSLSEDRRRVEERIRELLKQETHLLR